MNLPSDRIVAFELDGMEAAAAPLLAEERQRAIDGILEFNQFEYVRDPCGPYRIRLSIEDGYLVFRIHGADKDLPILAVSPRPYRRLVQDYFMMVESYEIARQDGNPYKLEAVDMGRRGIHNEGARLLTERLSGKIEMDFETARRFFTLVCVLHIGRGQHRLVA